MLAAGTVAIGKSVASASDLSAEAKALIESGFAADTSEKLDLGYRSGLLSGLHAVVVQRNGTILFERYFAGEDEAWGRPLGHVTKCSRASSSDIASVGITNDTAEFAVEAIRSWLGRMGHQRYPKARELTITVDCGGSNGARVRLWKVEPQKLADETGLVLHVGTSTWNRIEHRLFCHITLNWRSRPLTDRLAIVELIGATTTKAGLKVECALDTRTYEKGIKVSAAEMATLNIADDDFHPEWNYTIKPRLKLNS